MYWFQWVLHMRPSPSFWLRCAGKSSIGASWGSIPNRAEPMHFRMSAMPSPSPRGRQPGDRSDMTHSVRLGMQVRGWPDALGLAEPDRWPRRCAACRARPATPSTRTRGWSWPEIRREVVRRLYGIYRGALAEGGTAASIFPPRVQSEVQAVTGPRADPRLAARVAADVVAGMTEEQAVRVYHRLVAVEFGPLLDPAVL